MARAKREPVSQGRPKVEGEKRTLKMGRRIRVKVKR